MDLKKQVLDVYKLFIEDGETFLRARNLGKALRSAGKNPTDMEIHEMVNFANFHYDGFINPERFLDIFLAFQVFGSANKADANIVEEILRESKIDETQ
ncbi:Oidioi.mRNA.OKI2018_I69.chr2.g6832.t1.cds [Oikopleura dioica]|uniref:Oidioi.mRNA.OKI2018_I69.chr2.g6832.t1.cds n=1 Tax=Oikopleura dioica TaxID=34765 RepID=A0ABN7T496_OIKDI|nr:Oidioi.mRNA.OKI2018_I69.chr2.g6832.t1.cds [Oikopleura dioica]